MPHTKSPRIASLLAMISISLCSVAIAQPQPASEHTAALQAQQRSTLPFSDQRDFEESQRGFIAAPDYRQILGAAGNVVWDIGRYDFLLDGQDLDSIHPSLQRQATLNMNYGLYEVVPDFIYQIRGYDLANMTLIRGERGWILFDVLLTRETASAALQFANEQLGERPVTAVVYSHSHIDHFGGVRGVVDEADVQAGRVQIYAPVGFMEEAISENVYAGNAMTRRASYQYGNPLTAGPFGQVDSAIGKALARGSSGLIAPTVVVRDDFEEHIIDGVRIVFQNTPGTEAPAEMNAWFPDSKVFWAAENITASMRNVFLTAAQELRQGIAPAPAARGTSPDLARAMTTSQWWDAMATRVDSQRADGLQFIINFATPDNGEQFVVEMRGGTLTNILGYQSALADVSIRLNRSDLDQVIMGQTTLAALLSSGRGQVEGNAAVLQQLAGVLVEFDPTFEMVPGTATR